MLINCSTGEAVTRTAIGPMPGEADNTSTVWGIRPAELQARCPAVALEEALGLRRKGEPRLAAHAVLRGCGYVWDVFASLRVDQAKAITDAALSLIDMPSGTGIIDQPAEVAQALRALLLAGVERGLTVFPVWGFGISDLDKRAENRGKPLPSTVPIGSRIAIHTATSTGGRETLDRMVESAAREGWVTTGVGRPVAGVTRFKRGDESILFAHPHPPRRQPGRHLHPRRPHRFRAPARGHLRRLHPAPG